MDWNTIDTSIIATSSLDSTCSIWDINAEKLKTQIVVHRRDVFDVSFASSTEVFATTGADGSLRVFDLRYFI